MAAPRQHESTKLLHNSTFLGVANRSEIAARKTKTTTTKTQKYSVGLQQRVLQNGSRFMAKAHYTLSHVSGSLTCGRK